MSRGTAGEQIESSELAQRAPLVIPTKANGAHGRGQVWAAIEKGVEQ